MNHDISARNRGTLIFGPVNSRRSGAIFCVWLTSSLQLYNRNTLMSKSTAKYIVTFHAAHSTLVTVCLARVASYVVSVFSDRRCVSTFATESAKYVTSI